MSQGYDPQPQFGGYYAASINKVSPIEVEWFEILDGRLVLQHNEKAWKLWHEDVAGNLVKADANWPMALRLKPGENPIAGLAARLTEPRREGPGDRGSSRPPHRLVRPYSAASPFAPPGRPAAPAMPVRLPLASTRKAVIVPEPLSSE